MCGNGRPGSNASGVRTGKAVCVKNATAASRWRLSSWSKSQTWIPAAASSGSSACQVERASPIRRAAPARQAASCSAGVIPSVDSSVTPASTCWRSPATRTMKNSPRFEPRIARNLTRSRRGLRGSRASSSTRSWNLSRLSSRLTNRCGSSRSGGAAASVAASPSRSGPTTSRRRLCRRVAVDAGLAAGAASSTMGAQDSPVCDPAVTGVVDADSISARHVVCPFIVSSCHRQAGVDPARRQYAVIVGMSGATGLAVVRALGRRAGAAAPAALDDVDSMR